MKNFFTLLSFILVPALSGTRALAQHFEIGANGGFAYNAPFASSAAGPYIKNRWPAEVAAAYGLKGLFNYKKWQLGVSASYSQLLYSYRDEIEFSWVQYGFSHPTFLPSSGKIPAISYKLFLNRKTTLGNWESYYGISAGVLSSHYYYDEWNDPANRYYIYSIPPPEKPQYRRNGISAGALAGTTCHISNSIGINAEASLDYAHLKGAASTANTFMFGGSAGVRYRFGRKKAAEQNEPGKMTTHISKIRLGVSFGGVNNSAQISTYNPNHNEWQWPSTISPLVAIKGLYTYKKWQCGLSIEETRLSYKVSYMSWTLGGPQTKNTYQGAPIIYQSKLFVNRLLTTGKTETYAGVAVGKFVYPSPSYYPHSFYLPVLGKFMGKNEYADVGNSVGLRVGATRYISNSFGLNAEVAADFQKMPHVRVHTFAFSTNVGLQYRLTYRKTAEQPSDNPSSF